MISNRNLPKQNQLRKVEDTAELRAERAARARLEAIGT